MTGKRLAVFDMDGTMADSWPGMAYCYRKTFEAYGRADMSDEEFWAGFVGSLQQNLAKMLGISREESEKAAAVFRKAYVEEGYRKDVPYPGIEAVLKRLKDGGFTLAVATMRYERYVVEILEGMGIACLFDSIHGSDSVDSVTKADMIRMCMSDTGFGPGDTVMIGDGGNDMAAAEECGVRFIAATYGYGLTEAFCRDNGVMFAASVDGIPELVEAAWDVPRAG